MTATKTWNVMSDNPRPSHAEMDGESVEINAAFSNGLRFPGDPNGDIEEVAGCTCTIDIEVVAKAAADQYDWANNLSDDENKAFEKWATDKNYSERLNGAMRRGFGATQPSYFEAGAEREAAKADADLMKKALDRASLEEDTTVYRHGNLPSKLRPGDVFKDKGFVSGSPEPFTDKNITLRLKPGDKAAWLNEDELICKNGQQYRYLGTDAEGRPIIELDHGAPRVPEPTRPIEEPVRTSPRQRPAGSPRGPSEVTITGAKQNGISAYEERDLKAMFERDLKMLQDDLGLSSRWKGKVFIRSELAGANASKDWACFISFNARALRTSPDNYEKTLIHELIHSLGNNGGDGPLTYWNYEHLEYIALEEGSTEGMARTMMVRTGKWGQFLGSTASYPRFVNLLENYRRQTLMDQFEWYKGLMSQSNTTRAQWIADKTGESYESVRGAFEYATKREGRYPKPPTLPPWEKTLQRKAISARHQLLNDIYFSHDRASITATQAAVVEWMDAHPDDHEVTGTAEMLYMQLDAMDFKTPPPTAERHSYEGPDYKSVLDELRDMMNTERPTGDSAADDTPRSNQ